MSADAAAAAADQARVCHKQTQALIERQEQAQAQAQCDREKVKALKPSRCSRIRAPP